jgi:twinkle protein
MSAGKVVDKTVCPSCREHGGDKSGDNLVIFADGGTWCFACNKGSGGAQPLLPEGQPVFRELSHRGISKETCEKFGYQVAPNGDELAIYKDRDGVDCATHKRTPDKKFFWKGNSEVMQLWGQHLWPSKGKKIIITEGEIDAMSLSQVQGNKWPVVSIPSGASSGVKYISMNLDMLAGYDEVVFCFDSDTAGITAAKQCAGLLAPGKAKIAVLPLKDPNAMLTAGRKSELLDCIWNAKTYSPDELIDIKVATQSVTSKFNGVIWNYPWPKFNKFLTGQRSGEIVLWTSGSGSGKSSILRSLAISQAKTGKTVGMLMLEESISETTEDLVGIEMKLPLRILKAEAALLDSQSPFTNQAKLPFTEDQLNAAIQTIASLPIILYNSQGEKAFEVLLKRVEYLAVARKCDVIIIDHINVVATNVANQSEQQERLVIDNILSELRSIAIRTGVHIDVICQLKKSDKAYEEGDDIVLQDLKGSANLITVPNTIISMVRNRQDHRALYSNTTRMKVLKNRFTGRCGNAGYIMFDPKTFNFQEIDGTEDEKGNWVLCPPGGSNIA